jgi:hypothetical protein
VNLDAIGDAALAAASVVQDALARVLRDDEAVHTGADGATARAHICARPEIGRALSTLYCNNVLL